MGAADIMVEELPGFLNERKFDRRKIARYGINIADLEWSDFMGFSVLTWGVF